MDRRVKAYWDASTSPDEDVRKKAVCPPELQTFWQLGEHRLLVAGGVWDQPVGEWRAAQRAGAIYSLLERASKVTNWFEDTSITPDDRKTLEYLQKLNA